MDVSNRRADGSAGGRFGTILHHTSSWQFDRGTQGNGGKVDN